MSVTLSQNRSSIADTDVDEFRAFFIKHGWKKTERAYGTSSAVIMQLIAKAGGPALLAERAKVQRCGRKAGGKPIEARGWKL